MCSPLVRGVSKAVQYQVVPVAAGNHYDAPCLDIGDGQRDPDREDVCGVSGLVDHALILVPDGPGDHRVEEQLVGNQVLGRLHPRMLHRMDENLGAYEVLHRVQQFVVGEQAEHRRTEVDRGVDRRGARREGRCSV